MEETQYVDAGANRPTKNKLHVCKQGCQHVPLTKFDQDFVSEDKETPSKPRVALVIHHRMNDSGQRATREAHSHHENLKVIEAMVFQILAQALPTGIAKSDQCTHR
jgi:hypothetical protein